MRDALNPFASVVIFVISISISISIFDHALLSVRKIETGSLTGVMLLKVVLR